jgi:hypothetical protein
MMKMMKMKMKMKMVMMFQHPISLDRCCFYSFTMWLVGVNLLCCVENKANI